MNYIYKFGITWKLFQKTIDIVVLLCYNVFTMLIAE